MPAGSHPLEDFVERMAVKPHDSIPLTPVANRIRQL